MLAERDASLNSQLRTVLSGGGINLIEVSEPAAVIHAISRSCHFDLLIIGSSFDGSDDGLLVARRVIRSRGSLPIILIASVSSEELAISALRAGVADYFKVPFNAEELLASVDRYTASARHRQKADTSQPDRVAFVEMVGESLAIREIRTYLLKVGATESNALITGETGTGKELAAALIHYHSRRRHKPFVYINCAAIPDTLLESELFGYERGAFTGAHSFKEGTLKLAEGGSVFFDEIGDMSPYAQAKILRAIEAREVRRLGGKSAVPLDIRIIAATNRDLSRLTADDRFRSDLYFRLSVARIHLPPLRSRMEDLIILSDYYVKQMNDLTGLTVTGFTQEAIDSLLSYDWPGNVRELKNLIEAIFINSPSGRISPADLPEHFRSRFASLTTSPQGEREQIVSALLATSWNKSQAAQKLSWSRMTLYRKMLRHQIVSNATLTRSGKKTMCNQL